MQRIVHCKLYLFRLCEICVSLIASSVCSYFLLLLARIYLFLLPVFIYISLFETYVSLFEIYISLFEMYVSNNEM